MQGTSGALAFEFGDDGGLVRIDPERGVPAALRLARRTGLLRGPGKYRVLEHRRRQAQIKARRLLDLLDLAESRSNAR